MGDRGSPPRLVDLSIPRFESATDAVSLSEHLRALGMPLAFDPEQADFTGIATAPSPADRLVLSAVFHQAVVRVDEDGTAAATADAATATTGSGAESDAIRARFDRPFLFMLRDVRSGAVLFLGRVSDPR